MGSLRCGLGKLDGLLFSVRRINTYARLSGSTNAGYFHEVPRQSKWREFAESTCCQKCGCVSLTIVIIIATILVLRANVVGREGGGDARPFSVYSAEVGLRLPSFMKPFSYTISMQVDLEGMTWHGSELIGTAVAWGCSRLVNACWV